MHSSTFSGPREHALPYRDTRPEADAVRIKLFLSKIFQRPGERKSVSKKNSRHPQPSLTRSTGLGKHLSGTWKHGQGGCVVTCHICEFEQTEWDSIRPACACLLGNDSWGTRECSEWTATCIVECASSHLAPSSPLPSRIQFQRSTSTLFPSLH